MRGRRGGRGHGRNRGGGGRGDGAIVGREQNPVLPGQGRGRGGGGGRGRRGQGRGHPFLGPAGPVVVLQQDVNNPPLLEQQHVPFVSPICPRCNPLPLPGEANISTADEMLLFGLGLMGLRAVGSEHTNNIRFRSHYGIGPKGVFAMFNDLKQLRDNDEVDPCGLLMAMNFLKCYKTEPCMASRWGLPEEKIRLKVREYVQLVQQMKIEKVRHDIFLSFCFLVRLNFLLPLHFYY
jgi:hypothetical protein